MLGVRVFFFSTFEAWDTVLNERLLDYAGQPIEQLPIPKRTRRIWWLHGVSAQTTAELLAGVVLGG